MNTSIKKRIDGNYEVVDDDDDYAPMIRITFHNEWVKWSQERKLAAVRALYGWTVRNPGRAPEESE